MFDESVTNYYHQYDSLSFPNPKFLKFIWNGLLLCLYLFITICYVHVYCYYNK
jgi:hypothetical protein